MPSRTRIQDCTRRCRAETGINEKLDALADAIHEFAEFVALIDHQIKHIEMKLRRMELEM